MELLWKMTKMCHDYGMVFLVLVQVIVHLLRTVKYNVFGTSGANDKGDRDYME